MKGLLLVLMVAMSGFVGAEHSFTNALIHEKSPYLLQHAHNPVDWLPWGEEAFEKAKEMTYIFTKYKVS